MEPVKEDVFSGPGGRLTRRQVLWALSLLAAPDAGCSSSDTPSPASAQRGTTVGRLKRLLAAVRASPDHLVERAREVVATGDAERITRFVRESVAVLPAPVSHDAALWGSRGTLRGGAGVLRDRAGLLAELLTEAGFDAKVVSMARPAALDEATLYARPNLELELDSEELTALLREAGVEPEAFQPDDPTAANVSSLSQALLALLPEELAAATTTAAPLPDSVPIVELTREGQKSWAVALGEVDVLAGAPEGLGGPLGEAALDSVQVVVQVALNPPTGSGIDPSVAYDLVSASYSASDLVGRQLVLAFPPPGEPRALLDQDFSRAGLRLPILRLVAQDELPEDTRAVYVGSPLALGGMVLEPDDTPGSTGLKGPFGAVPALSESERASLVARAESLELVLNAAAFPDILLDLTLRDANGEGLDGLGANDFVVSEDGDEHAVLVVSNTAPAAVRVLVVYDTSGSVADAWATPDERTSFEASIAEALVAANDGAPFEVQVVALGDRPSPSAWVEPEADALAAALSAVPLGVSDVWRTVGEIIPSSGASAAILISDNASSLEDEAKVPGWKLSLQTSGIPIACIPLGSAVDVDATRTIVEGSGGIELVTDSSLDTKLAAFVRGRTTTVSSVNYRLRYRAPLDGSSRRRVEVILRAKPVLDASADYDVPATSARGVASGVCGLYVSVTIGGQRAVRRIAGAELSSRGVVQAPVTKAMLAEVEQALLGLHTLSFEPPYPTTAHLLDDAISSLLSVEPLEAAWKLGAEAVAAALPGVKPFPVALPALLEDAPLDRIAPGVTRRLGAVLLSQMPSSDGIARVLDVIPELTAWSAPGDAGKAFHASLERSLLASVRESQVLSEGAAAALEDVELVLVPPSSTAVPETWDAAAKARYAPLLDAYSSFIRFVPSDGRSGALWVIDPATGSATAIGSDGKGKGADTCQGDSELAQLINIALLVVSYNCTIINPSGVGQIACVGANVFGVGVLAYGSYTNPVSMLSFNFAVGAAGAVWSFAPTKGGYSVPAVASRFVTAVLQAMLGVIGLGTYCD
jgi:hypothetical protein